MSDGPGSRTRVLVEVLADHPGGLEPDRLIAELRSRWPGVTRRHLDRLVAEAGALVESAGGRLRCVATPGDVGAPTAAIRAVAIDLEMLVRETAVAPYTERRIWQVGAVRFGTDDLWSGRFDEYCHLDEGWMLSGPAAERHAQRARPLIEVLGELARFCAGAQYLVAYNGTTVDFAALDKACAQLGLPELPGRRVDGLYCAHLLWPQPASGHALHPLCEAAGVDVSGLSWHDAADDAEMLRRLLEHGATAVLTGLGAGLRELLISAAQGSDALALLWGVGGHRESPRVLDDAAVEQVITAGLDRREPARPRVRRAAVPTAVPDALRDPGGSVSPYALATAAAPAGLTVERRSAQDDMAATVAGWISARADGMVEAPTGSGKSLVALAAALDWLAQNPDHRAIIATHTKQLQGQLAHDVEALSAADGLGWLGREADLVKGRSNLLSLRSLVGALADCTAPATRRTRGQPQLPQRTGFREFAVYILLRLLAEPGGMVRGWEARSVDGDDLPLFFEDYLGQGQRRYYARALSQVTGDYEAGIDEITRHTAFARERLGEHRLVIGNHALLLANHEDLPDPANTLLIVDEAHLLEGTATAALSATVDYGDLERFAGDLVAFCQRHAGAHTVIDTLTSIGGEIGLRLDSERLPRAAQHAFDKIAGRYDREVRPRTAAFASPYGGDAGQMAVRQVFGELSGHLLTAGNAVGLLHAALHEIGPQISRNEGDRLSALCEQAGRLREGIEGILAAAAEIFGPPPIPGNGAQASAVADGGGGGDDNATEGAVPVAPDPARTEPEATPPDDEDVELGAAAADLDGGEPEPEDSEPDAGGETGAPPPRPPLANVVVWASEAARAESSSSPRAYRFSMQASPIELARDVRWAAFRGRFASTILMSATLRVEGRWDYIRERLGLGAAVREAVVPSPFDLERQAMLVAFDDFPSWAEHEQQALQMVAHQVAGFTRALARRPEPDTAFEGGAMVLTTSTAAASQIAELLRSALAGTEVPVHSAILLGNGQAVGRYRLHGGVLVGTKGLWAGVDVRDPERTRLLWINKLPFAPFADPLIAARRAAVARRAADLGHDDPDAYATEHYYLPLGAIELRQAVGRLIRSRRHRGVIVISDRKLGGTAPLRRRYREIFLGSLDEGMLVADPTTGERAAGNVASMADGWRRIWHFCAAERRLDTGHRDALCADDAIEELPVLAEMRAIRDLALSAPDVEALRTQGAGVLETAVVDRCQQIARILSGDAELELHQEQREVIAAVARGDDCLALLPTAFGKSFCYQLPALVLPGVTLVISPLVALMADQAYDLGASIGGAVRALVTPMRESSSRAGKMEVAEQLRGDHDHRIRIVYMSPERLAHRQVREWLRIGVQSATLCRIAIDEAHTLAQWGDDFRPSYRRLGQQLARLREAAPGRLQVTALTATANPTVRAVLRERVFGLNPADASGDPPTFTTVTCNPIRPELPIFRRQLGASTGGLVGVASVVEAVVDALDDHAILYCLTVREVEARYAQLRDHLGEEGAHRVRRFHARLGEAEKVAVLQDFKSAPRRGEDGFSPMIVVATSAFGLGINRKDVRCVFAVSPATDLASLYQQLGRAGRDQRGLRQGEAARVPSPGLALATERGFRTVAFLTGQDHPAPLLARMARVVLRSQGVVDAEALACRLVDEDAAAGRLSAEQQRRSATVDRYRAAVIWTVAALTDLGAVEDRGDFPAAIRVRAVGSNAEDAGQRRLCDTALRLGGTAAEVEVCAIAAALGSQDPAETWSDLLDTYHAGLLDVRQVSPRWLTSVAVIERTLPSEWEAMVAARRRAGSLELASLRAWFASRGCANVDLARYFGMGTVPVGTCADADSRCSTCWGDANKVGREDVQHPLLDALQTRRRRPRDAQDEARRRRRLDEAIEQLLWANFRGLGAAKLRLCLVGQETCWDARAGQMRPLPRGLLYHRHFGSMPGVRDAHVAASLDRLIARGSVVRENHWYRLRRHVETETAHLARQAQAAP